MLVTLLPFICMGTGLFIGLRHLPEKAFKVVDIITTAALILLMITIGGNIGTNQQVINKIGVVGINCIITCLLAILFSVIFCFIIEKTILPLKKYSQSQLDDGNEDFNIQGNKEEGGNAKKAIDPILYIIPISVVAGALGCFFFLPQKWVFCLEYSLWISLIILYISVGMGMGQNKKVFQYIRVVGFKVLYLVAGIFLGSIAGGFVSSLITDIPLKYAVISASGMGYYSMTGATMLQHFGAEAGVYGFMINVFRDFFTVLLLPVLARVGKSAPIAAGAGGNMDSMLVPVTKVVGRELGLVALIVGVVITFGVPVILPLLCNIFA
jgi:uncharacterized membrane protein YbjE (DUF340 family)